MVRKKENMTKNEIEYDLLLNSMRKLLSKGEKSVSFQQVNLQFEKNERNFFLSYKIDRKNGERDKTEKESLQN